MKNRNRMIVNCVTASLMYYWSLPALAEQSSSEIKIVRDDICGHHGKPLL